MIYRLSVKTFLISLCLIIFGCADTTPPSFPTIKIGVIYNTTGAQSDLDVPSLNGVKLALKQINSSGGLFNRNLEIIFYDGKSDTLSVTSSAKALSLLPIATMLGLSDNDMVIPAAQIAADADCVFMTSGATSPLLPSLQPDYLFMACFGDNAQAAAEYSFNTLQAKSAYLLYGASSKYTEPLSKYFTSRFTDLGGTISLTDSFTPHTTDFSAKIQRLKLLNPKPDVLYIAAEPDDIGNVVKQIRSAGILTPIFGGDSYDSPLLVQTADTLANNVYFTTHAFLDADNGTPIVRKFMSDYKAEYSNYPTNAFAALGYDAMNLVVDAIKRGGLPSKSAYRNALLSTSNFIGVTGSISYRSQLKAPTKPITIIKIENKKQTFIGSFTPLNVPEP